MHSSTRMHRTERLVWPRAKVTKLRSKAIRNTTAMFPLAARAGSVCSSLDLKKRELFTGSLVFGLQPSRHQPEGFTAWSKQGCTVINAAIAEKKSNKCANCSRTSKPLAEVSNLCLTFSLVLFLFFHFLHRKSEFL